MSQTPDLTAEDFARNFVANLRDEDDAAAVAMLVELIRQIEEIAEPVYMGQDPLESGNPDDQIAVFGHRVAVDTEATKGFRQDIDGDITIDGATIRIDADTGAVTIVTDDLVVKDSSGTNRARIRQGNDLELWSDDFAVYDSGGVEQLAIRDVSGTVRVYLLQLQAQSTNPGGLQAVVRNTSSGELRRWTGTAQTW